jgi:hypothetical protein
MQTTENTNKLLNFVSTKFQDNELDNNSLLQLIELCGNYLNLQTIPNYAKENNISYNGVKNYREVVKLFNVKFVIDNE